MSEPDQAKPARKFYRQVFAVEVLSEEPPLGPDTTLEDIAYEITEGHRSGSVTLTSCEQVDGPAMAKLLQAQGSDPAFFLLSDKGEDVNP